VTEKFQDKYRISSSRLRNWDYSAEGIYFIIICTAGQECYFGGIVNKKMVLSDIGSLVHLEWEKSFVIRAELFCDYFVIMPNHIHAILRIENEVCEQTDELHNRNTHNILPGNDVETDGRPSLQISDRPSLQISDRPSLQISDYPSIHQDIVTKKQTSLSKFGVAFRSPKSISSFVAGFKSVVTVNVRKIHTDFGWQTRFHDHIIHTDPEYHRIAEYIENNPANWEKDKFFKD